MLRTSTMGCKLSWRSNRLLIDRGPFDPVTAHHFWCMIKSMKICNGCKKPRDEGDFNANTTRKGGSQSWCKTCTTEYNRKWYEANKEKHRKYVREHDKRSRKIHSCKECNKSEPEVEFAIKKTGNRYYRRFLCRICEVKYRKKYPHKTRNSPPRKEEKALREAFRRASKENRAKYILKDSRTSDKKYKRENDLDVEYIKLQLEFDCSYCGRSDQKMTLDRIDNLLGHVKSNLIPCCIDCNYFRRDMPHEAWTLFVPAMKEARSKGLLDNWRCDAVKKKLIGP